MKYKENFLISVVIPTKNRACFLKNAIDSVLAQTYKNIELIVVDGDSSDNTVALLEQYEHEIKWISEPDKNLADAINKGINMSSGDYFITLASDEKLYPYAVESYIKEIKNNMPDIIFGQTVIVNMINEIINEIKHPCKISFLDIITLRNKLPLASSCIKMSIVKKNYFNNSFIVCQDFDFWLKVYEKSKVLFLNIVTAEFFIHKDSWSGDIRLANNVLKTRLLILDNFFSCRVEYNFLKHKAYVNAYFDYIDALYSNKLNIKALYYLIKIYISWPLTTFYTRLERRFSRC